jgi:glycosyltransferase involved in cell wall biosynthesis
MSARRPVLLVTNLVPPDRTGAFAALHAREGIELALFGGRSHHATAGVEDPGVPHRRIDQRDVHALAASGRYRAVVCGTAGRVALPAAWMGARRARVPFVLWSALWADLRTPAHLLARPLMAAVYRDADAVVAYGPHVASFAVRHGARRVTIAPQAVDNAFWSAHAPEPVRPAPFTALFVGRAAREKGVPELLAAWRAAALDPAGAALVLAGDGHDPGPEAAAVGVRTAGALRPPDLRNFYAGAGVVVIPSIPSPRFVEPWGLVANEAMNQRCAVIATDAVGAAAGGLVRHDRTGLVVPAGDAPALGRAIRRLHDDPGLRERLGEAGARAVGAYTYEAWAAGFSEALAHGRSGKRLLA